MICRNIAGIWDLDQQQVDANKEIMKFEGQIGKSLWCVTYSQELNIIATGGADTSIKLWSLSSNNDSGSTEEQKDDKNTEDVVKSEFDIKLTEDELPFASFPSDQYFIRSLCDCKIDDVFYLFASTNIGTIYGWNSQSSEKLKYVHSRIEKPDTPTDEFSMIDI